MKSFQSLIRPLRLLFVLAASVATSFAARADVVRMSASPNPARQGYPVTFSAYVNTGGRVDFFLLGRPVGTQFPAGPGWVSVRFTLPNVVPAGSQCIDKTWAAQQSGRRVSAILRVCR